MSVGESGGPHGRMSIMLSCADMKESVRFYRDVLGFQMAESWPDDNDPKWANMVLNGQSVMIGAKMSPADAASCPGDPASVDLHKSMAADLVESRPGAGVFIYLEVPDVDAHHAGVTGRGAKADTRPTDQFYGIRDFALGDPDGYRLAFFKPITLSTCQSCGMPLTGAKPGQMYCGYCTDEQGRLRPYGEVLEGTISGYFMGMKKMSREDAEKAASEHLATMPAWKSRAK